VPPAIANGVVAVTVPITAAVVPLLVSATFLDLLVPVASTLPKLIVKGAALSAVVGVAVGVGVAVAVGVAVTVGVGVAVSVGVGVAVSVGVGVAVSVGVGPAAGWMATNSGSLSSVSGPLMVAVGTSLRSPVLLPSGG
jgi:hypothetical protein